MYKIIDSGKGGGEVVLKRGKILLSAIAAFMLVFGIPLFLAGLLLLGDDEFTREGAFCAGLGLFFTSGAILIITARHYPDRFVFDNNRGVLRILEKKGGEHHMAYGELRGFHVGLLRQEGAEHFTVEMEKKNAAVWTFASFASRKKAEEMTALLRERVTLHTPSAGEGPRRDEDSGLEGVRHTEKNGVSLIEWKQRHSIPSYIAGLGAIFSFAIVLFSIAGWLSENIAGYYALNAFALILTVAGTVFFLYGIRRVYVLEIGRGLVRYYTKGLFARGLPFSLPLDQVDAVLFSFSIRYAELVIYFLSSEERTRLLAIKRGEMDDIVGALSFMMHLPRIDAGGFTVTEKLKLEKIIQGAMAHHGGKEDL